METYFNTKELSDYLRIPEQSIRRWVLNNEIPFYRIHGVIRYRLSEIEKWVDEHKEKVPGHESGVTEKDLFSETENAADGGGNAETPDSEVSQ